MALDVLFLLLGIALLVAGGGALVSGSSRLARSLGVSELVIGLTVVAFGTSAPELAVNVLAGIEGESEIAFGNVVGSNIANIALILGLCALLRPLNNIESTMLSREIPMMLLATMASLILGLDRIRAEPETYDRSDGLMLLLLFLLFLYYTVVEVLTERNHDPLAEGAVEVAHLRTLRTAGGAGLMTAGGLAVLIGGGQLTVNFGASLAAELGVPSAVIGISLVAVGTSLPELVTSVMATLRGQTSLAVGNVVGSNIFNLLFILGITAQIQPIDVPSPGGAADLAALLLFSGLLLPLASSHGARLVRWEGVALVLAYFGYMSWRLGV